jgi:transposase InsO family protein
VADGPGQVWSWDITYLRSPVRGAFYYLYMIEDVWSRKVVGWEVHEEESMELSSKLMDTLADREGIDLDGLVLHSDNGGPMKGATMLATLDRLGIVASLSRPSVSNDNPYSESLFRTMKYRPAYPQRPFASIEQARWWRRSCGGTTKSTCTARSGL